MNKIARLQPRPNWPDLNLLLPMNFPLVFPKDIVSGFRKYWRQTEQSLEVWAGGVGRRVIPNKRVWAQVIRIT